MASQRPLLTGVIFLPLICLSFPVKSVNIQPDCDTFPTDAFITTLKNVIDQMHQTLLLVSKYQCTSDDFRQNTAVNDCIDLVDQSVDELNWSLTEMGTNITATPHQKANVKSWLSAAYSNQDTCLDGFDGTDGTVREMIQGSLFQVTKHVGNVLGMVGDVPAVNEFPGGRRRLSAMRRDGFPAWLKGSARRMLQSPAVGLAVNFTVAGDGSGNFTRIMDAVLASPDYGEGKFVIYVKRGVYRENVEIKKKKWNLVFIGDGMDVTVISGNRSFVDGWTTFRSATFAVVGRGFIARDIGFENTAGPNKHQAVALRVDADLSAFFRCSIKAYQDTLYAHSLRQFYRECRMSGTVDFIFGNGAVVLQSCQIMARKPLPDQKNSVTAQGRKDHIQNTGFSLQYCNVSGESDLITAINSTSTYLGRPWKLYSRTVIMQTYLSDLIRPEGWLEWNGDFALDTLYYGEYLNFGPGAGLRQRVKWPGYHVLNDTAEANNFTVAQFINGNSWLPSTGVRFNPV